MTAIGSVIFHSKTSQCLSDFCDSVLNFLMKLTCCILLFAVIISLIGFNSMQVFHLRFSDKLGYPEIYFSYLIFAKYGDYVNL